MIELRSIEWMAARGWPLLVCHPRSKEPIGKLAPHAVHSATTDLQLIAGWLRECPDANWAVACGRPGPQVLDIDNPQAVPGRVAEAIRKSGAPRDASARGGRIYFAGTGARTVKLDYGELRGCGGYVLVEPSIHPTGKAIVWLDRPRGPLPPVPALLARTGKRAGVGVHEAPADPVPHGQRHPYLADIAVRLLRAGITDRRRIEAHLRAEFELSCAPLPPAKPGYFEALAKWAVESQIADRERACEALAEFIRKRNQGGRK